MEGWYGALPWVRRLVRTVYQAFLGCACEAAEKSQTR